MIIIGLALLAVCVAALLGCAWAVPCNNRTYAQRRKIIHRLDTPDQSRDFDRVSYDRHFWSLFLLRDPMLLYSSRVRSLMETK